MIKISILSFIAIATLLVSLVSAGCNYNVTSMTQLVSILMNDQTGWTTVPTLCFAAGTYTLTSNIGVSASQNWVGPQQGVDPTCGRLINPPCARYTSASTFSATVEAIFQPGSYDIESISSPHVNLTMDGFTVNGNYNIFGGQVSGTSFTITFKNTYVYKGETLVDYIISDHSYFGWPYVSPSFVAFRSSVLVTLRDSYFYQLQASNAGSITAIGNTFAFVGLVANAKSPSHFENNMFCAAASTLTQDTVGQISFKNNTFWFTETVYAPSGKGFLDFESNCFVQTKVQTDILNFAADFNTSGAVFTNNYFGNPNGPQIKIDASNVTTGSKFGPIIEVKNQTDFDFKYSSKHLHFAAPTVCPRPIFSLTVKPHNIMLGETVNITISFELDPLIVGAGFAPSLFDGVALQLLLAAADINSVSSNPLGAFPANSNQMTWNPNNQSSLSVIYTIQPNDLVGFTNGVQSPPNFYVYMNVQQTSGLLNIFNSIVYAPITITPKVPLECYNISLSINKNVTAAPLKYNFQQLGCSSENWEVISVNSSSLFSYDNNHNLVINTGANLSGVRLAHYQIAFYAGNVNGPSNLVHNVVTKINIVNHNPVINSANFTWTYPRTQQTFPNWNILTNCTDQDGDNVTVVQIQRNRVRTNTSVVQLDDFTLHFVPEKVVVSVLPTGEITFTAPSNSNPVTAGAPLVLFWKQSVSFQFQITDGDVIKQYAWGIANIDYVQLNE